MSFGPVATLMSTQVHGPLSRTSTAPVFTTSAGTGLRGLGQTMSNSQRSSQVSGSTGYASSSMTSLSSMTSSATLVPPPQMAQNNGNVVATNNIINQRADASRSLYQICVNLRARLAQVPGFSDQHLKKDPNDEEDGQNSRQMDPVSALWRLLRKGAPLLTIWNALQPTDPLYLDANLRPDKVPKVAAFKFVEACLTGELQLGPAVCFSLQDLFGDDTTGFVKVTQVINLVLDVAEEKGFLMPSNEEQTEADVAAAAAAQPKMTYRDHVVKELVDTERKYVQDLENLHELKKVIEHKGVIPGDVVHAIFLNINAILDFQRRFLIKIETTNSQPDELQEWGLPFTNYKEAFSIYQPFIANQKKAAAIAKREFDKIVLADHPVVVDFNTLDGFLLKPMQRLVKYPLLLKDLRDKTAADEATKADLTAGIEAANAVLMNANSAVDAELLREAYDDLNARVDDWKNHRVDHFGDLLLYGHFPVVTGKSDVQKEYTIYLFERILLCCKEVNPNKSKDKLIGAQKDKKDKKDKNKNREPIKNAKLLLKGRIFMTNVTDVASLAKQGSYTVQIFWKGDPGVENFVIRFSNEETMRKWYEGVDSQRKLHATNSTSGSSPDAQTANFTWIQDQGAPMTNPYQEEDDDEDDYVTAQNMVTQATMLNATYPPSVMPRTSSTTSLRSRSTTGESQQSLAGIARAPPPRFPMGLQNPPLSLQTAMASQLPSPGPRGGDSYFSPVAESPASSRTSASNGMYPFPRQTTPPGGWEEQTRYDQNRNTAPAMPRAPSRGSQTPMDAYRLNGRSQQRPSLPAVPSSQQRSRSYSTPDITAQNGVRRLPNGSISGQQVPAVPGIPAHLHPAYDAGIPRSANSSPNGLPMRSNTQSPGVQRDRLTQQAQYPSAPQYSRSNTTQLPTSNFDTRTMSPPLGSGVSSDGDFGLPTQLKVKVNCDGNYVTLVVAFNITYQSLVDRIDAKVGRFSSNAIAAGTMKLRYRDEDGDFISIDSDDDIQLAFQEWREAQKQQYQQGQLGEIELFCHASVDN